MIKDGKFRLALKDDESLPVQRIKKSKSKKQQDTFNVLDEMGGEEKQEIFTVKADLFDYGPISFKSISSLVSYVSQKGFACSIFLEGEVYGSWSPEDGVTKFI